MKGRLPVTVAALWWGSLTTIFWVVPMLFAHLPSPALAGGMAARLFSTQTWITIACCMLLLMASRPRQDPRMAPWARPVLGFVLGGLLLALLGEFAVSPRIVARENLKLWHSLGSGMLLLQWVCAGVTFWKLALPAPAQQGD
ncbi:DUF4149 domain-containing protein [Pseudorhodoferax sp. Leaf267]|uniref:DUF4149 domain-containing protein n=1 Tax=Pseudorhodoferax sp. Leaf267 TaxID=1736316 RepID=UPI0006FA5FA6|nr:DUF4149 domain-containing protein [Pseudorhodoferax sp. Leaf267]KQP17744.1 hypothetical protein ASF43_07640 [Pseudorhodoferax sp. Leaf267]